MDVDDITKRWVRNRSDELAIEGGCRFDEVRGRHVLDFARNYLLLYEGEKAGQPLDPMPWQIECTMRMFGWWKWSERWKRKVRRFTQASIWAPKKTAKSPTLSWWALYLFCGDGEQGQKVYFAAKDGMQAREIAGKHAVEMVLSSPALLAECTINKSLLQITHDPTRSILKPISSNDSKSQKAKEGLNGSIMVDETHVVDREFMSRVSRAGISRSEPMLIEVSTAGDDPMSYGRERYEYGKEVESGIRTDERLFFQSYEAPQDLKDEDLVADPVKYGKMANPSWGVTIDEAEYLADFNASRRTPATLADFKKYRLDIWQKSSNPWLPAWAWEQCRDDFTDSDLEGQPCYLAFDLSRTRDTTALAQIFPLDGDDEYKLLVDFWLPQVTAERLDREVSYKQWARQGWLTLNDGDQIDYTFVRLAILDKIKRFDVQKIVYDDVYATQMVQRLIEEDNVDADLFAPFKQTIMEFAAPAAKFERLLLAGKIRHNGNGLLTWQAGHVSVKCDPNQNIRPVKPPKGDRRTIDGIVASVMALGAATAADEGENWYVPGCLTDKVPA